MGIDHKLLENLAKSNELSKFIETYLNGVGRKDDAAIKEATNHFNALKGLINSKSKLSNFSLTDTIFGKDTKAGGILNISSEITKALGDNVGKYFQSQLGQGGGDESSLKIFELIKKNGLRLGSLGLDSIALANDEILKQLKAESELRSEIATKTGLSGDLGETLREDMKNASIEAARYGVSLKEMGDFYVELVNQTGRFNLINSETYNEVIPLARALDMSLTDFAKTITDFEKVGVGSEKTIESLEGAASRSLSLGLSAKSITKGITDNIEKLNSYGFKNGIQGLELMVRRSKEFRFSMDEVFKVADKVFEPEGAIEMVANLQMIGGAIGDLNDPMRLLYMSTNDIEGLQEAIIGAAGSVATYNEESKTFEITGVNLRRAKAEADALGISYTEFSKLAIASAERSQAAIALSSRGLQIKDDDMEFLTNLARMENGEMKITVPESLAKKLGLESTKISLDNMNDNVAQQLLENKKVFEKMSPEDIAMEQLTETEKMSRGIDVIASYFRIRGAELLKGVTSGLGGDMYKDLQDSIDEYSQEVKANSSNNIEAATFKSTRGFRDEYIVEPLKKVRDYGSEMINNVVGDPGVKQPVAKVINVNHTLTFNNSGLFDQFQRYMVKNPEMLNEIIYIDKSEYTSNPQAQYG